MLQNIPFMAGIHSLVRPAGRLHFCRTLEIVTTTLPSSRSTALATADASCHFIPANRRLPSALRSRIRGSPRSRKTDPPANTMMSQGRGSLLG